MAGSIKHAPVLLLQMVLIVFLIGMAAPQRSLTCDGGQYVPPRDRTVFLCTTLAAALVLWFAKKVAADGGGGARLLRRDSKNSIDSGGKSSSSAEMDIDDAPASQFTVMLRQCHLGERQKQYLNVPADFQNAHGYDERTKVVLRMRGGKSWPVNLKHNIRAGGKTKTRASLRYGWHQFCVDNRLGVGDTCFFRALRGSGDAGEDHELNVEVRRRDGTFAD